MAVFGVGTYSPGDWMCRDVDRKHTREYVMWKHMLERCYSPSYLEKYPTYVGCSVADEFKDFQQFMKWASVQVGFGNKTFCLDKDILVRGNKVYGPTTCAFVPNSVNMLLLRHAKRRGCLPIGVSLNQGRYMATLCIDGRNKNLGRFSTPEEAFEAYKEGKEKYIKDMADRYRQELSEEVYQALLQYKVEYTD